LQYTPLHYGKGKPYPKGLFKELRILVRERDELIKDGENNQERQIFRLTTQSRMESKKDIIIYCILQ